MPGGYPDAPGGRLAYDLDGTQLFRVDADGPTVEIIYPSSTIEKFNNEHNGTNLNETSVFDPDTFVWLFNEPKDLFGCWASGDGDGSVENFFTTISVSGDAKTATDGSWVGTGAAFTICNRHFDTWREDFQTFSASGVWGFRGVSGGKGGLEFVGKQLRQVHIYGETNDAAVPDRILLLDKASGLEVTVHDWGYTARGDSITKEFQVKNNSATFTADSIDLGFDSLNSHSPDAWHTMKDGAGSYSTALSLGSVGPGATYSNDITVKIDVPSTAGMGPWTNRVTIDVPTWST